MNAPPGAAVQRSRSPSPEYVYAVILFHFGSWENAAGDPDGRAMIDFYLPIGWYPPEGGLEDKPGWWNVSAETE